jgi:hypothetical protein
MNWFFKWIDKKCKQAGESSLNEVGETDPKYASLAIPTGRTVRRSIKGDEGLHSRGVSFTLYAANGGTVVELRDYDHNTDRNINTLYIIPSEKDLGEQLGHIVTMEALKR